MGRFDTIKTTIDANIKENGSQEITGQKMNSILTEMVNATDAELTELESEVDTKTSESDVKTIEKIYGVVGEADIYNSDFTDSTVISDEGVETISDFRRTTTFIPVVANARILILNSVIEQDTEVAIATYDSQKNFIAKHNLKVTKLFNVTTESYVKFTRGSKDAWSARIVNRDSIPNRTDSLEKRTKTLEDTSLELTNNVTALENTVQEHERDIQVIDANNSNSIFNNLYGYEDVMIGKYLVSSGLADASRFYKSIKLNLEEGYYYYFSPGSSSGLTLVKFTDDTYSSVEKVIVGRLAERAGTMKYLTKGYYIFSYNDNKAEISMSSANFIALTSPSLLIGDMIGERVIGQNLISSDMVIFGARILPNDGTIQNNVAQYYKLARFEIAESCDCIVKAVTVGDNAILWKYDNEWNPVQEIIPYQSIVNRPIKLEKGKYAISWNSLNFTAYDEHECYVITYKPELWNNIQTREGRNYGVDIKDFSEFSGNWTISENKKTAISSATGIANALTYPVNTFEDECELSMGITPTSDKYEVMLGKTYLLAGTLFSIGKDSQGDYVGVYIHSSASAITMTHKFYFTGLNTGNGKRVILDIRKFVDTTRHYDVCITDANGKVFEKKGISNWQNIEGDQYNNNKDISGSLWGKITIYVNTGSAEVDNISFGYPKDMSNLKLVIMGHSFVEGASLEDEQEKRFSSLLKNSIGEKNVVVIGRGGGGIIDMNACVDRVLIWCKSARYVFMFIGANDEDSAENATKLGLIDKKIRDTGIIPIWANIPHRYGQGQVKPILNAYIESNLNYIDVASVFRNADGTLNQSAYMGDNLHPSAIGHQLIYNCIRANCSYLFNL